MQAENRALLLGTAVYHCVLYQELTKEPLQRQHIFHMLFLIEYFVKHINVTFVVDLFGVDSFLISVSRIVNRVFY